MLEVWMLHSYQKVLKNLCYENWIQSAQNYVVMLPG